MSMIYFKWLSMTWNNALFAITQQK